MKEENITKNILIWLVESRWKIVSYDFPQSGTGILLHPNKENRTEKNKGGIIPDIIAVKDGIALYFENKDRFHAPDFEKIHEIKTLNNYSKSLSKLLKNYNIKEISYGIGMPDLEKEITKAKDYFPKIDFLVTTNENKEVFVHYDIKRIFLTP